MAIEKDQIASILDEIGTLLELKGENPFKCRAFHNAARTISTLTQDIHELVATGELRLIKGIGEALTEKITELVQTGKLRYYEELKASLHPGLLNLLRIQGLGPKRVKLLHDKLHITSVEELRLACEQHLLATVEGFGVKTEENILQGIEQLQKHVDKHLYPKAYLAAESIVNTLKQVRGVIQCEVAGSLRRKKEIIGDIDILVSAKKTHAEKIIEAFASHPAVDRILAKGDTKSSVILKSSINCDLRVVDEKEFPFALNYFTGSKEHNIEMRSRAKKFDWSLNEYGFSELSSDEKRGKAKRIVPCRTEVDIYKVLGMEYIPPELRENMGEFEAAEKGLLPQPLEFEDIRGTFHAHTTYSDGVNTLAEMAQAAIRQGWEYLGIADHSKSVGYAGGLSEERVKLQAKEIEQLNKTFSKFRLFKGTEVDILPDGSLDWSDRVLSRFDFVVASVHMKFKMTESEATKRIIKALKNKHVTMLGHPTGRLLLEREGYPLNMRNVIDAASDYGKIIEINAHPTRFDLDWRWCRYAKERGVRISINPDAHKINGLNDVRFGIGIARKGWLEKQNILNSLSLKEICTLWHIM